MACLLHREKFMGVTTMNKKIIMQLNVLMIICGLIATTTFAAPGEHGDLIIYKGNPYQGMSQIELYQYCGRLAAKKSSWKSSSKGQENKWLTIRDHCISENSHYLGSK
jgi:hypothetical protein